MTPYTFTRQHRAPRTIAILIVVYGILIGAYILFDAVWWLLLLLALPTLPALWDIYTNTRAGLSVSDDELWWFTGRRDGALAVSEIDHMRFDTRWDFTVRVSACLRSGQRVRLPDESLPPHRALETIFAERGIKVVRHHFTVF